MGRRGRRWAVSLARKRQRSLSRIHTGEGGGLLCDTDALSIKIIEIYLIIDNI